MPQTLEQHLIKRPEKCHKERNPQRRYLRNINTHVALKIGPLAPFEQAANSAIYTLARYEYYPTNSFRPDIDSAGQR
jgi:hypothetical protein